MFIVHCASCDEPLCLPDEVIGRVIRCLKCKATIIVSEPPRPVEQTSHFARAETNNDESRDS